MNREEIEKLIAIASDDRNPSMDGLDASMNISRRQTLALCRQLLAQERMIEVARECLNGMVVPLDGHPFFPEGGAYNRASISARACLTKLDRLAKEVSDEAAE